MVRRGPADTLPARLRMRVQTLSPWVSELFRAACRNAAIRVPGPEQTITRYAQVERIARMEDS